MTAAAWWKSTWRRTPKAAPVLFARHDNEADESPDAMASRFLFVAPKGHLRSDWKVNVSAVELRRSFRGSLLEIGFTAFGCDRGSNDVMELDH